MAMTLELTPEAERYLRTKVHKKHGHGAFVSTLLIAEQVREEVREQLARHAQARQEQEHVVGAE
jgi:hypothetical protein